MPDPPAVFTADPFAADFRIQCAGIIRSSDAKLDIKLLTWDTLPQEQFDHEVKERVPKIHKHLPSNLQPGALKKVTFEVWASPGQWKLVSGEPVGMLWASCMRARKETRTHTSNYMKCVEGVNVIFTRKPVKAKHQKRNRSLKEVEDFIAPAMADTTTELREWLTEHIKTVRS